MIVRDLGYRVEHLKDGESHLVRPDGSRIVLAFTLGWGDLRQLTVADVVYNVLQDPAYKSELTEWETQYKKSMPDLKRIRRKLKLTQTEFASQFRFSLTQVREWERHKQFPNPIQRAYLQVIWTESDVVRRALSRPTDLAITEPEQSLTRYQVDAA